MNSSQIKVHFDGSVFEKQTHGGISRVFTSLLRELKNFSEVEAYLHLKASVQSPDIPASINVIRTPVASKIRPAKVFSRFNHYLTNRRIRRQYESYGNGVFHSTYYSVSPSPLLRQVFTLHDMIFEDYPEYFKNTEERENHIMKKHKCIEEADVIACDSAYTKLRLAAHYPHVVTEKLVKVIHLGSITPDLGLATSDDQSEFFADYKPFLLHVGSRHPHKNFNRIIDAFCRPELAGLNLVSVGGGKWTEQELQLMKHSGVLRRMYNLPRISDRQLSVGYRSASAVVIASITEGFGLPLLEALSFGCAVACSRGGSLPEVGGDVPVYFDPLDVDDMAAAIELAVSAGNCKEGAEQRIKRAEKFSWSECAARYVDLYRQVSSEPI